MKISNSVAYAILDVGVNWSRLGVSSGVAEFAWAGFSNRRHIAARQVIEEQVEHLDELLSDMPAHVADNVTMRLIAVRKESVMDVHESRLPPRVRRRVELHMLDHYHARAEPHMFRACVIFTTFIHA